MDNEIYTQVDHYISNLFALEDDALKRVERSIQEAGIPQISVSPVQGKLLQVLAKLCRAQKILEIGTLAGYSTIWLARALPANGRLITLEIDPHHAAVAQKNIDNAQVAAVVNIRTGKALDLLSELEKEGLAPFDLIFIDADKEPYTEYFQWALRLSRSGTLIVADNIIREGKVLQEESEDAVVKGAQRFNKTLAETKGVMSVLLQTIGVKGHDGIALAVVD